MTMSFNDFIHEYTLKREATSNKKSYQVLYSIGLDNVDLYLRDGVFSDDIGIVNLHSTKGTQWPAYINEKYFSSHGCPPPQKVSKLIIKRNGHCLYSKNKIQGLTGKRNSYCASYKLKKQKSLE